MLIPKNVILQKYLVIVFYLDEYIFTRNKR